MKASANLWIAALHANLWFFSCSTENWAAARNHRPTVPWVRQASGSVQQLDGGRHGRPAGHLHRPHHRGNPGERRRGVTGNPHLISNTHPGINEIDGVAGKRLVRWENCHSSVCTVNISIAFVLLLHIHVLIRFEELSLREKKKKQFHALKKFSTRKKPQFSFKCKNDDSLWCYCCGSFYFFLLFTMFWCFFCVCLRDWAQPTSSSKPRCQRRTRSARPSWASTTRSPRLCRPIMWIWPGSTPTPPSTLRRSTPNGTR